MIQLHTNIAVSRRGWGSFCYFNMEDQNGPVMSVDQVADPELGQFLLEQGQRFWDEHVEPRIPPNPADWAMSGMSDAPPIVETSGTLEILEDDDILEGMVRRLLDAKDMKKEATEAFDELKVNVLTALLARPEPIGKAQIPGLARLSVVTKKGRVTTNMDALKESMPLDRDKVAKWVKEFGIEFPSDVDDMMADCGVDFDLYRKEGNPSQYLLPNRTKESK